jgi:hypothetical protein
MRTNLTFILAPCLLLFATAAAQTPSTPPTPDSSSQTTQPLPDAPKPAPIHIPDPSDSYLYNLGAFCGIGVSTSPAATKPTGGCGAGLAFPSFLFYPLPIFIEAGVMAPQANRSNLTGYISVDSIIPLARPSTRYLPIAIVGYSRLFETGHSFDYGVALAMPRSPSKRNDARSLRIELRDYWTFANPTQHNVMLRVGWMTQEYMD